MDFLNYNCRSGKLQTCADVCHIGLVEHEMQCNVAGSRYFFTWLTLSWSGFWTFFVTEIHNCEYLRLEQFIDNSIIAEDGGKKIIKRFEKAISF
jgi:hypothetical protein